MSAAADSLDEAQARRILDAVGVTVDRMDWVIAICRHATDRSGEGFIDVVTQVARIVAIGRLSYGDLSILSERRIFHLHELASYLVASESVVVERLRAGQISSVQFLVALSEAVAS